MKTGVLADPILVGREHELEELQYLLDLTVEGKGNTVFVSGEAGSGKTRLTQEFLRRSGKKGVIVLSGWCLSNAAVPYFPFVEAFNSYFSVENKERTENEASEINAWLTGLKQADKSGKQGNLTPQAWKDLTFAAVTKALISISAKKPTILFIEDIQWADSASLSLLHYIARTTSSKRVFTLATFRSEELTADAEGHSHPLTEELRLMRREDLITEIKLSSLNKANVSKIAENMIGGSVQPGLVAKLSEESRGNPLFVVESLRMLSERGNLYQENGQWCLSVDALGIPNKFKDIILRRLAVLKFSQRRVLDAASVIGERFEVELLGAVLGQDSLEVLEALNIIAQSTSLISVEAGFFRFDHAKSREAIYEEIPLPLRKGYHARVAERLEIAGKTEHLPFSDIAYHYAEAGNNEKAVKFAMDAGQDALSRFSNAEAIKHFAYVLQTTAVSPKTAEVRKIALEGLGDAYYANCMFDEAIKTFEILADSETSKLKLRALRKAMDAVFSRLIGAPHLLELAKMAEKYAGLDRLESARIRLNRGKAFGHFFGKENFARSLEDAEEALRVFEEEYSLPDAAEALTEIGIESSLLGLQEKAFTASLRSIAIFEKLGCAREETTALIRGVYPFMHDGLLQEAWDMYTKVNQIGEKIGDYSKMAEATARLSRLLEIRGRCAEALVKTSEAVAYSNKTDAKWIQVAIYADFVRQYSKLGNIERAEEYYCKLMKLPSEIRSAPPVAVDLARTMAVYFAALNQWKEANEYFEEAFEIQRRREFLVSDIAIRTDLAWALSKRGQKEKAETQLEELRKIYEEVEKKFAHVNIQASLMAPRKVVVGDEFEMRLDLVNVSRKPGLLCKTEGLILPEFKVFALPDYFSLQNGSIKMGEKTIGPFHVEVVKIRLKAPKACTFDLNPQVTYIDESGKTKICKPNPITIAVQAAQPKYEVLPGRIPTGFEELDASLFGGLPEHYAVALASPSTDERGLVIERFLESGVDAGEVVFNVALEAANAKGLTEKYPLNFYLFLCNPQDDTTAQNLPNVFKLKGVENLTDIDIALTKAFRTLGTPTSSSKRICIEIISDVLLQHQAVNTRRWLSALLPTLKSKGFTILAVVDPVMHPPLELQAVLNVFDGEIRVTERETAEGSKQTMKIRKLINQKYSDKEIALDREVLSN